MIFGCPHRFESIYLGAHDRSRGTSSCVHCAGTIDVHMGAEGDWEATGVKELRDAFLQQHNERFRARPTAR